MSDYSPRMRPGKFPWILLETKRIRLTQGPRDPDSDHDGLPDGQEDRNHGGRVESGETNPAKWDTDHDGLCDGLCSGSGEDKNLNGTRDQDANGEWTETDFLANDSDVDGVSDGREVNGTYCFKNATSTPCSNPALDPLNADFDGDGLRDGQELAGWVVGVWYERTMEKKENRSVTSYPWLQNSDEDNLTDFAEFMNGSDPRAQDTDGDGLNDSREVAAKSNITGIEGTPPQIEDVKLVVGTTGIGSGFFYLPTRAQVTVSFTVTDNVGVSRVDVKFIRRAATDLVHLEWARESAPTSYAFSHTFDFPILEALLDGADVNITAFDTNENGAWGQFHIQSVVEAVVAAILERLSAIAHAIVEAASAAINWIWDAITNLLDAALQPIKDAINGLGRAIGAAIESAMGERIEMVFRGSSRIFSTGDPSFLSLVLGGVIIGPLVALATMLMVLHFVETATKPFTITFSFLVGLIVKFVVGAAIGALVGAAIGALSYGILDGLQSGSYGQDLLAQSPGGSANDALFADIASLVFDIAAAWVITLDVAERILGPQKGIIGEAGIAMLFVFASIMLSLAAQMFSVDDAVGAAVIGLLDGLAVVAGLFGLFKLMDSAGSRKSVLSTLLQGMVEAIEVVAAIAGLVLTLVGVARHIYDIFQSPPLQGFQADPGPVKALYMLTLPTMLPLVVIKGVREFVSNL